MSEEKANQSLDQTKTLEYIIQQLKQKPENK